MNYINKLNLFESKMETITMFDSPITRKIIEMGYAPGDVLLKVCAETPKDEESEAITKSILCNMVADGYTFENKNYRPFMAGASDARKATSTWVEDTVMTTLGKWCMCGLQTKTMKLAINKYMAYIGLLSSASKPFVKVFGKKINVRRVAIIKDTDIVVNAFIDLVTNETGVSYNKAREIVINAFDGHGWVRKELTGGESCTLRDAWIKAFVQAIDFKKLFAWCVANNIKPEFKDYWNNVWKLKDVDIILTASCFKTVSLYESWEQYCTAHEELGHEICVCVREHAPKLKGLPYQQGQTLIGNEDDALSFAMHAKKSVYKYHEPKKAANLLYGYHGQACKMYPAMMNEKFTTRTMQEKYTTKRNDMLGGRIPELGYNAFLAPDPVAFAEHLFGLPIKGYMKAGECYCSNAKEGPVDVTRNPHLDNAHCVLNNVKECPLTEGPTMFINIFDMVTIRLRADYDGDHVWYSQDEHLLDLINRTYDELKNIPIDWDAPKAPKSNITKSAIAAFITNLIHGSEIGLYADALTKMWSKGYDRDVCDWLTYAANVLIDSAKHGNVKIKIPEAVKNLNFVSLPLFAMYAKANDSRPANSDYWLAPRITRTGKVLPPRCAYSGSFLDMYSKNIQDNVPETLTVEGLEDEVFDSTKLMFDIHRPTITGLSKKGTYDPETKTFKECGLFQDIAFRHSTEWNKLVGDTSFFQNRREWEEETAKSARKEILDWARALNLGMTDDELELACYDVVVRNIFNTKMSDGMDTVVKQAFWRIYGDLAVRALKNNLNSSIPDFDSEEFEELFDVD